MEGAFEGDDVEALWMAVGILIAARSLDRRIPVASAPELVKNTLSAKVYVGQPLGKPLS